MWKLYDRALLFKKNALKRVRMKILVPDTAQTSAPATAPVFTSAIKEPKAAKKADVAKPAPIKTESKDITKPKPDKKRRLLPKRKVKDELSRNNSVCCQKIV